MLDLRTETPLDPRERLARSSWLQIVSHLDPKYGGIAASLPMFCRSAWREGVRSPILGFCDLAELRHGGPQLEEFANPIPGGRLRWMLDLRLRGSLRDMVRREDGLHIHGIWENHCAVAASMAQACRRPYIVSAHGMLERWALQHKRIKKALYAALVETGNLRKAACLRALTLAELGDYRRIGLTNPVAVVPNGVAIPAAVTPEAFQQMFPELTGKRIVLFLGRLHPKKGLAHLLRAWAKVHAHRTAGHLVLAGPDSEGTCAKLREMAGELGIARSVTFAGMLTGATKWSALAASSVFVLPSFSEGFSVAVLEALGMRVPVIVTHQCNFPEVQEKECGWVIEPEQAALEVALEEALRASPRDLAAMGVRGRALVQDRYSWEVVGKKMADVYGWVLGGSRPSYVETASQ